MYHQISNKTTDINMQTVTFDHLDISTYYVDLLDEQALEFFHAHRDTIELYYVLENNLEMHLIDESFPSHQLDRHDFVLINSGIGHNVNYSPNQPKKYFVVNFSISKRVDSNYPPRVKK